jgi:hypothetical protein
VAKANAISTKKIMSTDKCLQGEGADQFICKARFVILTEREGKGEKSESLFYASDKMTCD